MFSSPHPSIPGLGPTRPPVQWVLGLFPGNGIGYPPSSRAEVKQQRSACTTPLCRQGKLQGDLYFTLLTIKTLSQQVVVSNVSKNEFWTVKGRCGSEKIFLTTMQRVQLFQVRAPIFLTHCVQHEVQEYCVKVTAWVCAFTGSSCSSGSMKGLLKALCCKPEGRGFDSRWDHVDFLLI